MALPIAALARLASMSGKAMKGLRATSSVLGQVGNDINMLTGLVKILTGNWFELNDIAFKTARTMALSREQAEAYNKQLIASTRELAAQFGISAKELAEFQQNYAEAVGRNVILTKEQISHMAALSKITDNATAQQLVDEFDKVGIGIKSSLAHIGHMQEKAKAFGVNASKASKSLVSNIKLASSYSFRNGVADIEKMTLRSTALRVNMESIMRSTEKFANLEDAVKTSAELQVLGGSIGAFGANPMANMYNALANPAQYQEDVANMAKSLVTYDKKTGETNMAPVQAMIAKATADAIGMSREEFMNMAYAGVKNDAVMKQMGSKADEFTDEQKAAIQNLARGNFDPETGKYFITWLQDGKEHTKNVEDITADELKIAQDSQATEENMRMDVKDIKTILERVHGRARETVSTKEQLSGLGEYWLSLRATALDPLFSKLSGLLNTFTNTFIGKKYFSTGGIATPIHAAEGTVVPGDSYTGDKVPAMLNSGEMVLNPVQQKSMFNMISSLAMSGGMLYGMNKLGGKMGVGGIGNTMLLANVLGDGDADVGDIIEAHYIKKSIKGLKPFKESIKSIGETAKETSDVTTGAETRLGKFGKSIDKFSQRIYSPFDKIGKKLRSTRFAKGISDYFDTLKNTTYDEARKRSKYYKNGKPVAEAKIKGGKFTRGIIKGKSYFSNLFKEEEIEKEKAKPRRTRKTGAKTLDIKTGKEVVEEKVTTAKTAKRATKAAKSAAKASKALGAISKVAKVAKVGGRVLGPLGTLLTVGSSVYEGFQAKSKYDKQLAEINRTGLSGKDKAVLKDKAEKERNQSIGGSIGGAIGATALGTLGFMLGGPLGSAAGAWLGNMAGEWAGKGIGGLFGGNNSKKYENPAHAANGLIVPGNSYAGDKVPVMANSGEMILDQKKQNALFSALGPLGSLGTAVKALPDVSNFLKVLPPVGLASTAAKTIGIGKTNINLNVSGTIKLEGNGKSVDFDISKLLETPEFKRKLADILTKTLNENSNGGKRNMESERLNMANQYNKTGA